MDLPVLNFDLIKKDAVSAILKCNERTSENGLVLTEKDALALLETRTEALRENGRIEFGGGIIERIIDAFCDSPYLTQREYLQTIHDLVEAFYCYKNETLDEAGDDELIRYMKIKFDGVCQGSVDLLVGRELYKFAEKIRSGDWVGEGDD